MPLSTANAAGGDDSQAQLAYGRPVALGLAGLVVAFVSPALVTRAGVLLLAPVTLAKARQDTLADKLPSWRHYSCFW